MKTLILNLKFLSMALLLTGISSCSLDTKVKTFAKTVGPVKAQACQHADAVTDHPICEEFIGACVFYACKNETDPNYSKYLEYEAYINGLTGTAKSHSTIIHDSSKCVNKGSKIQAVIFSISPSAAGFKDEYLSNQPEVSIVRVNGEVAKVVAPITLSVHKNSLCSDSAVSASNWSMASANPVNTVDGKHLYQNLKLLENGTYYLKAESGALTPACSSAVVITDNLGIGKKVVFLNPKPSSEGLHSRDLAVQPKVGIINAVGDVIDIDNQDIELSLYSDDKCLTASAAAWEATANPVKSVDGISQFDGVAIKAGGTFYFRATSGSLLQDCYGPIKVADRLKFSQNPGGSVVKGVVLAQQPIVAVAHQDNVVAPFENVAVKLSVYTDAQCSVVAPSDDYTIDNNSVNSNAAGLSPFSGLKFLKEAKYYIRGESTPLLPTACIPVDVGSNVTKVVFLNPLPSVKGIKDTALDQQPKVGLVDGSGAVIPENGKSVLLTLHSDNACHDNMLVAGMSATTNPGQTVDGMYQFAGVKIQNGGVYYLKVSSPNVESSCFGPIEIAQKLKLEQSATATVGVPLVNQPIVKVVLPNDSVVGISGVPITYKVYKDAQCSQAAAADQWSMSSTNPVLTNSSGLAQFSGVVINDVGSFYSKATTTANLDATACLPITTSSVAHSLVFAQPYISTSWVKGKEFVPQPTVNATDSSGIVLPITIPVELSLHTDSSCSSAPLASGPSNFWDVNATPNQTTNGVITFAGFKVYKGGKYYLKAKTSAAGVLPACSFQFIVADSLYFNPAGQASMVQNIAATTDTKVQAVWKVLPSTINNTTVNDESVTISVYKEVNCTGAAVPATDWHFTSSNPKATVNGDAIFSGLVFTKAGTYYLKATSPNLDPVCSSTAITVTPGGTKIVFVNPLPSKDGITNVDLENQPKVQIVDTNGDPITNDDKEIKITIASDAQCNTEIPAADYAVNAPNPAMTSHGMYQFSGVKIKKGGLFYIKASGAGLDAACFGPVEIADALTFLTQPITPHNNLEPELFANVGPTRPVNIHILKGNLPITVAVYKDNKCETTPYDTTKWKLISANSNGLTGNTALTTVNGKVEFVKFKFDDEGEYYLKATSPNLAPACSSKFILKNNSGDGAGCTEPLAKNYNPKATKDDCSCVFEFCPLDKPAKDSPQAKYNGYAYDKQCKSVPDFVNTCAGGSCDEKKDSNKAEENKKSGYVYQCDKYKAEYDEACQNISSIQCSVNKANYEACFRAKTCSQFGLIDDASALKDLELYFQKSGVHLYLFNSPDQQFEGSIPNAFQSLCIKLRYPDSMTGYPGSLGDPSLYPMLKDLYNKYCDCQECEDAPTCNHPDADNYNPAAGAGVDTGSGVEASCDEAKSYVDQYCLNSSTNPNIDEKCKFYKEYYKYCTTSKFCNLTKDNWLYPDLVALINGLSSNGVAKDEKTCAIYNTLWSMCSSPTSQGSDLAKKTCTDFYTHVKSCGNGTPSSFYGLDCSNYDYYLKTCAGKCGNSKPESCEFSTCQDPNYQEYKKYLEYAEYCKKSGVTCDIQSDPELCKTPIVKDKYPKSIKVVRPYLNSNSANPFEHVPMADPLELLYDYAQSKLKLATGVWGHGVDELNEQGSPVPMPEASYVTFFKDDKCLVPVDDVNCRFPGAVSQAASPFVIRYMGNAPDNSITCQLPCDPNNAQSCELIQKYKLKSVSGKESLCRPVKIVPTSGPNPNPTPPPTQGVCGNSTSGHKICWSNIPSPSSTGQIYTITTFNGAPTNANQSVLKFYSNSSCSTLLPALSNWSSQTGHRPNSGPGSGPNGSWYGISFFYALPLMTPPWYVKVAIATMPSVTTTCLTITQ